MQPTTEIEQQESVFSRYFLVSSESTFWEAVIVVKWLGESALNQAVQASIPTTSLLFLGDLPLFDVISIGNRLKENILLLNCFKKLKMCWS